MAVVQHMGGMGGGHYVAYVRKEATSNQWFYVSDSNVTEVSVYNIDKAFLPMLSKSVQCLLFLLVL